jgi:flagellar basal-body rod protein FlgG
MIPAFNHALSGLNASEKRLSVHGNNIANVNTTGFKSSRTLQSTLPGGGTQVSSINQNFNQGGLDLTGMPTDYAIEGPGFFRVGENNYTRNGAFSYDANGDLVTAGGLAVDPGEVQNVVNPDGLTAIGASQFQLSSTSGAAVAVPSGVMQGALETSNVDMATEVVGSILSQRAFEFNVKTIKTADEMMGTILNIFA